MAINEGKAYKFKYIPDKCNPPDTVIKGTDKQELSAVKGIDMGTQVVFPAPFPGTNYTAIRPHGWTEYEAAFRHQYIPDPCPPCRPCRDPCRPKGVEKRWPPRQFVRNDERKWPRYTACGLCNAAKGCCSCGQDRGIKPPWQECKEKVVVYDPDNVRTLLIKGEVKNEHPFVISNKEYERVVKNSEIRDPEKEKKECEEAKKCKEEAKRICREKADLLRIYDENAFNQSLSPEQREDEAEILCRAETIIKEDEPEVRNINAVILATKAQAIREAQLQERELIRRAEWEETRRIEAYIRQEADQGLTRSNEEEEKKEEEKRQNLQDSLEAQLDEIEAEKFMEKEALEREREAMLRQWEEDDLKALQKKEEERAKKQELGLTLLQDQLQAIERKQQEKEMERELDQRLAQWQREKAAEMERLEEEKREQKRQRDRQIKAIQESQKRQADAKALRDELRAKRHQEAQEKAWREKERSEAAKRARERQELKQALGKQMTDKELWLAEQATLDKLAHDKVKDFGEEKLEEEQKKEEERKEKNAQYMYDIREQFFKDNVRKIRDRKMYYVDALKEQRARGLRERELRCWMDSKLEELRANGMPEKYIKYVAKQVEAELTPEWMWRMGKTNFKQEVHKKE